MNRNYQKTNRNPRAEEYNDWTEEFNREFQQPTQPSRRKVSEK